MIFFEPIKSKFLHELYKDIVAFWHPVGPIVKAIVPLHGVDIAALLNVVNTSRGKFFSMNLLADLGIISSRSGVIHTF